MTHNTLVIDGSNGPSAYCLAFRSAANSDPPLAVERATIDGSTVDSEDAIHGTRIGGVDQVVASGSVNGGSDSFIFDAERVLVSVTDDATDVRYNGDSLDITSLSTPATQAELDAEWNAALDTADVKAQSAILGARR